MKKFISQIIFGEKTPLKYRYLKNKLSKLSLKNKTILQFHSEGSIKIGDEIVNINGESLRGQPYPFVHNLIATCTSISGHLPHTNNAHVDLVICRSISQQRHHHAIQFIEKQRNKSVDTYFDEPTAPTPPPPPCDHHQHFTEFASIALK